MLGDLQHPEHAVPPGGAWAPLTQADQRLYSNGQWLQYHGGADLGLLGEVHVPDTEGFGLDG